MSLLLRDRADLTLDQVATLVSEANSRFGGCFAAERRHVLVQTRSGSWANFGSLLRLKEVKDPSTQARVRVDMGALLLLSAPVDPQKITDAGKLQRVFTSWRSDLGLTESAPWQTMSYANRYPSRGRFGPDPVWSFEFHEAHSISDSATPEGPFVSAEHGIFADKVGTVAASWLDDAAMSDMYQIVNGYRLIIPDRRARIAHLDADAERMHVQIEQRDPHMRLFCGVVATSYHDERMEALEPVTDGAATIRFPRVPKLLRMWVMSSEGEWLDRFEETPHNSSWGEHLLHSAADEYEVSLQDALSDGEGPTIEFKEWIATRPQDKKSLEFLRTLVAFANTHGGDLYIGVDDHANVCSILRNLEKEYGDRAKGDLALLQEAYIRSLLKMATDRISPKVRPDFTWLDHGGVPVLRVRVVRGLDAPYALTDTQDIFVRRGATDRKASTADLHLMFTRKEQGQF